MKLRLTINVPNWLDRIFVWPVLEYRRYRYGQPFRKIGLTEGKFTIVDQKDFYWLNNFDWFTKRNNKSFYAVRLDNDSAKWPTMVYMHRQIMNSPLGLLVDHRNRIGFDNRRDNLRTATYCQNNCNKPQNKAGCSSQYRGVNWDKQTKRWRANLQSQGKFIGLGYFDNEIDAAKAYDRAAIKYHGDFARLNFSRDEYTNDIRQP